MVDSIGSRSIASRLSRKKRERSFEEGKAVEEQFTKSKCKKSEETNTSSKCIKCDINFFAVPCEELAQKLLGCILCRKSVDGTVIKGRIMETEAYLGCEDKAAHSYNGKRTPKNEAMYMPPGTCYVYSIYGIHCCMNISSQGEGAAVLIRALEPLEGVEFMKKRRTKCKKDFELCRGPAKLCQALDIGKDHNKVDMCVSMEIWVESDGFIVSEMISCPRVGIDYAEEWINKPLRFYVKENKCVSKLEKRL